MSKKPVIVSAIQPTGELHLGNYLGAVRNWVELQNSGKYDCYFFIVDYHSLTGNRSAAERKDYIIELAAELLAAGIDPQKSTFFVQSHVQEHTELGWIFNCVTPMAELERMTQFKDKAQSQKKNVNVGLFTYPVLQAADILMYKATHVPVGEDQVQHVELTRDIGRSFNKAYDTDFFPSTEALLTDIPRVKSLLEPTKKMSKSKGENHVICLADEPEVIAKKLKKAVTASPGDKETPGVNNLILLLNEFGEEEQAKEFAQEQKDGSIRYGDLKTAVAEAISTYFADFRTRRHELITNREEIAELLAQGAQKAQTQAKKTMQHVRKIIGVR